MTFHEFYPELVEGYGLNGSVLYRHIDFCAARNPKDYTCKSFTDFEKACPYMSRKQVRRALQRICDGKAVIRWPTNPVNGRRKYRYYPRLYPKAAHTFDTGIAAELGVLPAVIYANVRHFIELNWREAMTDRKSLMLKLNTVSLRYDDTEWWKNEDEVTSEAFRLTREQAVWYASPLEWRRKHPYAPLRSVERAFEALVPANYLVKVPGARMPGWRLPDRVMDQARHNIMNSNKAGLEEQFNKRNDYVPDEFDTPTENNVNDDLASPKPLKAEHVTSNHRQKGTLTAKRAHSTAKRAHSPPKGHTQKSESPMPAESKPTFEKPLEAIVKKPQMKSQIIKVDYASSLARTSREVADASSLLKQESKPVEPENTQQALHDAEHEAFRQEAGLSEPAQGVEPVETMKTEIVKTEGQVDPGKTLQAIRDQHYGESRQEAIAAGKLIEFPQEEEDLGLSEADNNLSSAEFQALVLSRRNGHSSNGAQHQGAAQV